MSIMAVNITWCGHTEPREKSIHQNNREKILKILSQKKQQTWLSYSGLLSPRQESNHYEYALMEQERKNSEQQKKCCIPRCTKNCNLL